MDRPIVYTQEQGRSTDFLFGMRSAMIGLAKLSSAVLGANTLAHGFACTPNSPAALNVLVGLGEIYALAPVDGTAYGVLPADTTDTILKQGIQLGTTTLSCPAPTTTGFSINYLIEAGYQDSDTTQVVLPYFNSANPAQPLNGPGGLGGSNATERQGIVVLQAKAGTAATTGTQTTPAPDSGFVGLWVVTVAFGASTITSGNIAQYPSAPFITNILQMLQTGSSIYAADTSGTANTISLALTPPVTAYTDGEPIRFKAANTNTGAVTINWGGGNISLTGANGALQGGEIIALKQYEAIYSAATGTAILIGQSAGSLQVAPATASQHAVQFGQVAGVVGSVRNLKASLATAGTSLTLTADEVIAETALGGLRYCLPSFNQTVSTTTTGIGGVVGTALAASGFAAVYAAYNPTTLAQGAFIVNANSLVPNVAAAPPAGWVATGLISVWPLNSSTQFMAGGQLDRNIYIAPIQVYNSNTVTGSITALTSLSISSSVPANAKTVGGSTTVQSTAASITSLVLSGASVPIGSQQSFNNTGGTAGLVASYNNLPLLTPQTLFYGSANTAGTPTVNISISGYSI
jgi:hypothetical protein